MTNTQQGATPKNYENYTQKPLEITHTTMNITTINSINLISDGSNLFLEMRAENEETYNPHMDETDEDEWYPIRYPVSPEMGGIEILSFYSPPNRTWSEYTSTQITTMYTEKPRGFESTHIICEENITNINNQDTQINYEYANATHNNTWNEKCASTTNENENSISIANKSLKDLNELNKNNFNNIIYNRFSESIISKNIHELTEKKGLKRKKKYLRKKIQRN